MIRVAVERGFISVSRDASLEMHPLLRSFLEQKLREESPSKLHERLARVVRTLMTHELWDEASSIIDRFNETDLLAELIESSLDRMLSFRSHRDLEELGKERPADPAACASCSR